ncbi:MAG: heme A synthase [Flavobacteriales bacterium]|nr:heme A synthase [Flavobacteriales bacterium]
MARTSIIRFLSLATLVAVYLVILAGSVVRMTGSGMGCPDWPKCFGEWIPPTDASQLPEDYEAYFLEKRKAKLIKYTDLVEGLGMSDIAEAMRNDPTLLESEPFDARGTWIEYVNRLLGFISGNLLLLLFIFSLGLIKRRPIIPITVFIGLVAISFQAWLGSVVVATNLLPWTITIHMVVAFLIIGLLIGVYHLLPGSGLQKAVRARGWLFFAILLTLVQVVLGTQVRQEIDYIAKEWADRSLWIDMLSTDFEIHRSFSILLLLINGYFLYRNRALWNELPFRVMGILLVVEILLGMTLAYLHMPALAQPLHLLVATLFFGAQCWILLRPNGRIAITPP